VGEDDRTVQLRFFYRFGIDVLSAQTLNAAKAAELKARLQ
jgi:hypothetical protein